MTLITPEQERIVSLRDHIQKKRQTLGLDVSLIHLKSLKKYGALDFINYPQSISNHVYYLYEGQETLDLTYLDNETIGKHRYVYSKLIKETVKKIRFDLKLDTPLSTADLMESLNAYRYRETYLNPIEFLDEPDLDQKEFIREVFKEKEKVTVQNIFTWRVLEIDNHVAAYSTCDVPITDRLQKNWKHNYNGRRGRITDPINVLARAMLLKITADFLYQNESNFSLILERMATLATFDQTKVEAYTKESFAEVLNRNALGVPDFFKSLIVLTLEEMIHDENEIKEMEKRLTAIGTNYAKTYMTKKNIPLKTQAFMKDNHFLAMFGTVEADELCNLDKLSQLALEFTKLSDILYLPVVQNHSLRFRRLGHHKAAGLYYPGFNTLAVDIDNAYSFIHELFHLIDYENGLLSLDAKFKPLLTQYRQLLDNTVKQLGKECSIYKNWFKSGGKYGRSYYLSNEEVFARLGELYVLKHLGIQSSFNNKPLETEIEQLVYPTNEELLNNIKPYFDELFEHLNQTHSRVSFKSKLFNSEVAQTPQPVTCSTASDVTGLKSKTTSKPQKSKSYETYHVIEQLSLSF